MYKRLLCSANSINTSESRRNRGHQWAIKQVTKSNFKEVLEEFKASVFGSDFIAVCMQKTGRYSSPWQKILPFDTTEIAYLKAKRAAESYQIFQFSVCPFSIKDSKLVAHPYNFHLFPRNEFKVGMPSYSFSCQSSSLESMAGEGFDFNSCIYDGISYVSRAQESAFLQLGRLSLSGDTVQSPQSVNSIADSLFVERIKYRVKNWINACTDSNISNDALISSLRKFVAGSEEYCSRPCLSIDVCSERQVQLSLEMLKEFSDVVPLRVPAQGKGVQAVRVVLTSSEEDKDLLKKELQDMEELQNKRVQGFREVIELISTSQKPVVVQNSVNDFSSIYSQFVASLPLTMNEFWSSLRLVFPRVLDTDYLLERCNSPSLSYLKKRLSTPIGMEIPNHDVDCDIHGHNVVELCQMFVKLNAMLKLNPEVREDDENQLSSSYRSHLDSYGPVSDIYEELTTAKDIKIWSGGSKIVSTDNLVFLWGLESGVPAGKLKSLLLDSDDVFSEEFDVRMVDRTCGVIVFWSPGYSQRFLRMMHSGEISSSKLKDMVSHGLRATGYETYQRACELVLWDPNLAECLDRALAETESSILVAKSKQKQQPVIYFNKADLINLDEL